MKTYRKNHHFLVLLASLLCAVSLYAGGNREEAAAEAAERRFLVLPPDYLAGAKEGVSPEKAEILGADFAGLLVQNLGESSQIGEYGDSGIADIREYALLQRADAAVYGFFVAEQTGNSEFFGRLVLRVIDLGLDRDPFSLSYQGRFFMEDLESVLPVLAECAASGILERTETLSETEIEALDARLREASAEKRARRTVRFTLQSKPDSEAVVLLHDGTSPGTLAGGEISFEIPAESRYRITVEKPGHYTRIVEGLAGTEDISVSIPELYPEMTVDRGFVFSYLRPFGLLFEGRYRLFRESATLGASVGLFPLPDYREDEVFAPDFGDLLIESELGFHLGWYPFSRPDSEGRIQLELNMRINTYTNPYQDWRTFRALMTGAGLRFELNRPTWLAHIGIRGYYPNYTPAKVRESGIVLINLGAAWKN
jgi:hypothetical protein